MVCELILRCTGRFITKVELEGRETETLHYNNTNAIAAATLAHLIVRRSNTLRGSLIEAGGVPALVKLLRESTSPATVYYTAATARSLLLLVQQSSELLKELADKFLQSGEMGIG